MEIGLDRLCTGTSKDSPNPGSVVAAHSRETLPDSATFWLLDHRSHITGLLCLKTFMRAISKFYLYVVHYKHF